MENNYMLRVETYFNVLTGMVNSKYDYKVFGRELDKIMQLGLDKFYTDEQRAELVKKMISFSNESFITDIKYKALILAYAYKINQINECGLTVPACFLEETLVLDTEFRDFPESLWKDMSDEQKSKIITYKENAKIDEDLLRIYNISLAAWRFRFYPINEALRGSVE